MNIINKLLDEFCKFQNMFGYEPSYIYMGRKEFDEFLQIKRFDISEKYHHIKLATFEGIEILVVNKESHLKLSVDL